MAYYSAWFTISTLRRVQYPMIEGRTDNSEHDDPGKFTHMSFFAVSNIGLTLGDTLVAPSHSHHGKNHTSFGETVQSSLHFFKEIWDQSSLM